MLAPSLMLRASSRSTRRCARVAPQYQRRAGHGHHHESLAHLERPTITPANFSLLAGAPEDASLESVQNYYKDSFNNGEWIVKFINSKTALRCLAEINGTEFHHPLKASVLTQVYQDQLSHFESVTKSALEKEGFPPQAIEKLHYVYSTRAHVEAWEVEAAIKRFSFLRKKLTSWRVVTSGKEHTPTWKKGVTAPFLGTTSPRPEYLASEQAFGRFPATNEAAAVLNVIKFRGLVGFVNAVMRGLTPEERQKVRAVLVQPRLPIRLSENQKAELDATVEEIRRLSAESQSAAEAKLTAVWKSLRVQEKRYFFDKIEGVLPKGLIAHQEEDNEHHEEEAETYLEEGTHYFTSEESRKEALDKVQNRFFEIFEESYARIQKTGDGVAKAFADKFKQALNSFFSPEVQGDIELMTLLRSAELSERQLEDIFSIFRDTSVGDEDYDLLMDAVNPHPVSRRLFGERIRILSIEPTEYTKHFHDGADSTWPRQGHWPAGTEELLAQDVFKAPMMAPGPFNTGMDEVMHLKLLRLATDFYGLDLDTDLGMATFEQLVHTFDISPGEETLDRTHPTPPDQHTYEELPIIKFDGWEESDELPPESEVENFDAALIEANLNSWLQDVAAKQGTEFKPIRQLKESLDIDEHQLVQLRSVLTYEIHDKERLRLLRKIWGVVLPEKQVALLFTEKEEKLLAAEHQH